MLCSLLTTGNAFLLDFHGLRLTFSSYYVSKDCLARSLEAATGGLHRLGQGDRVALYTTHCTHGSVASTVPDKLLPLNPVCLDTEEVFRALTRDIAKSGMQSWNPPRPTPSMTNVVLAVAKSLHDAAKQPRCHMILLSPVFGALHSVTDTFPDLHVHQINPAIFPFIPEGQHKEMPCEADCCKNILGSNWAHYQSVTTHIKRIILYARSEDPIGTITDIHVDLRPKSGCEVLKIEGPTATNTLRSGQTFSFLARLRVSPIKMQELCANPEDSLLKRSLDATSMGQEIHAAQLLDAKLVHLLSVQVFYQNTLNALSTWSYTEAPVVAITKLGRVAPPQDVSVDVYRRRAFHAINKVDDEAAKKEVDNLAMTVPSEREDMQQVILSLAKEVHWHHAVHEYETLSRKKLPLCSGPIGKSML